jgi:hypothetical protein
MLKKLLALFLLACTPAFAQAVVQLNPQGNAFLVASSPLSNIGTTGQWYVFPVQPQNALLFEFVDSSGVSGDTYNVSMTCTTNPNVSGNSNAVLVGWNISPLVQPANFSSYLPSTLSNLSQLITLNSSTSHNIVQSTVTGATQCGLLISGVTGTLTHILTVTATVLPTNPYIATYSNDACSQFPKSSVSVGIATAGSGTLVAATALANGQQFLVCGYQLSVIGASQTFAFASAATCTAPSLLTGAMGPGTGTNVQLAQATNSTQFAAGAGLALCYTTTGTTVNVQGYVTYVIR